MRVKGWKATGNFNEFENEDKESECTELKELAAQMSDVDSMKDYKTVKEPTIDLSVLSSKPKRKIWIPQKPLKEGNGKALNMP